MPTTNNLTDAKCRAARATDKPIKVFDGGGLHLFVSPTGAKAWRVAYRRHGKPQTMSLGPYPAVSLAEARKKREELKATLRDGVDPMAQRRQSRANALTLREAGAAYWGGRKDLTEGYRANALRALEMHLFPQLGGRPIGSITRDELMQPLAAMDATGLHVYVRKTRMWVSQVFDWAVERGEAAINPAALIKPEKAFGRRPVEHFAALTLPELPGFLQRLALEDPNLQSVLACRLLALTWVRTAELRKMTWAELDGDVWRIPAPRMKRKRDHLVPLSPQAVAIISRMRLRSTGSDYVFPSDHRTDRPMSENAVLYLLHRMGLKGRMTGHGFRTVGSTWANESGFGRDAIERQLAHAPDDKTRATYNRAEYLPERRAMLVAWADWLERAATQG